MARRGGGRMRAVVRHPLETVLCGLMVAIVAIIFTQVVTRYLLHVSLSWSEEFARYLLIWLAMLSAAYGFKIKAHFALVFVVNRFPGRYAMPYPWRYRFSYVPCCVCSCGKRPKSPGR